MPETDGMEVTPTGDRVAAAPTAVTTTSANAWSRRTEENSSSFGAVHLPSNSRNSSSININNSSNRFRIPRLNSTPSTMRSFARYVNMSSNH